MTDAQLDIYPYELPLVKPFALRGVTDHVLVRRGLIIALRDDKGHVGFGEVAPLPGFHQETLEEAQAQLEALQEFSPFEKGGPRGISPTVTFGLDIAQAYLQASQRGISLATLLGRESRPYVDLHALIDGDFDQSVNTAIQSTTQGYRALKIKVGRASVQHDIEMINAIRKMVGKQICLRPDANRAWTLDEAVAFAEGVRRASVEYVEEPLRDPGEIEAFYDRGGVRVALDETMLEEKSPLVPLLQRGKILAIGALVVKPTVVGSLKKVLGIMEQANSLGISCVLSATFESGLGLSALAELAAMANTRDVFAGIATHEWLKKDLLQPPFRPFRGRVDISSASKWGTSWTWPK